MMTDHRVYHCSSGSWFTKECTCSDFFQARVVWPSWPDLDFVFYLAVTDMVVSIVLIPFGAVACVYLCYCMTPI